VPPGLPTVTTPAVGVVAAAGAAAEEAGGRCSLLGTLPVPQRNPRPLAAVDTGKHQPLRSRSVGHASGP